MKSDVDKNFIAQNMRCFHEHSLTVVFVLYSLKQ